MKNKEQSIIIKRIKKVAGGHHGGMWKVAYADFVTAMMVFFLLLWIINNVPKETLSTLGNYFEPTVFTAASKPPKESVEQLMEKIETAEGIVMFNKVTSMLDKESSNFLKIEQRDDSVMIALESSNKELLFQDGKAELTEAMKNKLNHSAKLISKLPYYIALSSHTNGLEINVKDGYNNWDLSIDRVNNVRKFLMSIGLSDDRLIYMLANSNSVPKYKDNPASIENRRIEILLLKEDKTVGLSKKNLPTDIMS